MGQILSFWIATYGVEVTARKSQSRVDFPLFSFPSQCFATRMKSKKRETSHRHIGSGPDKPDSRSSLRITGRLAHLTQRALAPYLPAKPALCNETSEVVIVRCDSGCWQTTFGGNPSKRNRRVERKHWGAKGTSIRGIALSYPNSTSFEMLRPLGNAPPPPRASLTFIHNLIFRAFLGYLRAAPGGQGKPTRPFQKELRLGFRRFIFLCSLRFLVLLRHNVRMQI